MVFKGADVTPSICGIEFADELKRPDTIMFNKARKPS